VLVASQSPSKPGTVLG